MFDWVDGVVCSAISFLDVNILKLDLFPFQRTNISWTPCLHVIKGAEQFPAQVKSTTPGLGEGGE